MSIFYLSVPDYYYYVRKSANFLVAFEPEEKLFAVPPHTNLIYLYYTYVHIILNYGNGFRGCIIIIIPVISSQ